jgi:basic amino acid/polyamine antiporter, APA family
VEPAPTVSEAYERSIYRLPRPVLRITAIGAATTAGLVWLAMASQGTTVVVTITGFVLAGYLYYRYLCHRFAKSGFDLRARLAMLDDHESGEVTPTTPSGMPGADARST